MISRTEHDSLGMKQVPGEVYYGVQTLRAVENFRVTGTLLSHYPLLIRALGSVKEAAALTNRELGILDPGIADAIVSAAREVQANRLDEHFVVDVIQGGAGTSTNMNANEVIANRALELLGHDRGEYRYCHPNNHVNLSQSTNDVYPTAVKIASVAHIQTLLGAMQHLRVSLETKGREFASVIKMGRTQLQDAVPMTLGQEFDAYAVTIGEDIDRLTEASRLLHEINLGATAIGTGINAPPGYVSAVCKKLRAITGLPLETSPNLVEATSDAGVFVQVSGVLKRIAVKLSKLCNDLRLLSSGPRTGLNEINLPAVQPGSTIMPGKVNPVIPEVVNQICFQVMGNDMTITLAAQAGQLELNAFEPVIGANLFQSIQILERGCRTLAVACIDGITANVDRCRDMVEDSIGIVTALVPYIGYDAAAELAGEALQSGERVLSLLRKKRLLSEQVLTEILDPQKMTHPRSVPFAAPARVDSTVADGPRKDLT
ncbi:MAG TPA: aspartate ammonia-lyase [Spirochaetia bacterium]|nr:aspartate ammonia-lyase [Spirochaetia bacterium]